VNNESGKISKELLRAGVAASFASKFISLPSTDFIMKLTLEASTLELLTAVLTSKFVS